MVGEHCEVQIPIMSHSRSREKLYLSNFVNINFQPLTGPLWRKNTIIKKKKKSKMILKFHFDQIIEFWERFAPTKLFSTWIKITEVYINTLIGTYSPLNEWYIYNHIHDKAVNSFFNPFPGQILSFKNDMPPHIGFLPPRNLFRPELK